MLSAGPDLGIAESCWCTQSLTAVSILRKCPVNAYDWTWCWRQREEKALLFLLLAGRRADKTHAIMNGTAQALHVAKIVQLLAADTTGEL